MPVPLRGPWFPLFQVKRVGYRRAGAGLPAGLECLACPTKSRLVRLWHHQAVAAVLRGFTALRRMPMGCTCQAYASISSMLLTTAASTAPLCLGSRCRVVGEMPAGMRAVARAVDPLDVGPPV